MTVLKFFRNYNISLMCFPYVLSYTTTKSYSRNSPVFWNVVSCTCSPLKVNKYEAGSKHSSARYLLQSGFLFGLFSTLNIEATDASETSVDFQRTTRFYISENKPKILQILKRSLERISNYKQACVLTQRNLHSNFRKYF
jgi:hypothetical protein